MKRLIVLALLLFAGGADAQAICSGQASTLTPFAYEAITVSSSSIGFTAVTFDAGFPNVAVLAVATLETDSIRFRVDGGVPTSTVGQLVTQASNVSLSVCGTSAIRAFRAIRVTTDASLKVVYYRAGN